MRVDAYKAINASADKRLFRSHTKLSPDEINDLLGVRVSVTPNQRFSQQQAEAVSTTRMFRFALVTVFLVAITITGSMYQLKIGPFYESKVAMTSSN